MKASIFFCAALLLSISLNAQTSFAKNDIYFEAGGNGLFASINYERQITAKPGFGVRLGIGVYGESSFYLTIPAGINYLFPLKNQKSLIDAGVGVTWSRVDGRIFRKEENLSADHFVNFVPSIGYRRHTSRNVMWRISITPVINNSGVYPWLGASIGKRF